MKKTLSNGELAVFSEQLSMILHSGISSLEGIMIMKEDLPQAEGKQILESVYESLEMTGELAESFRSAEVFPKYYIKMTEIGERSGTLEEVMTSLSDYYRKQDQLMKNIRDALTYPVLLLGMLFCVLIVLMTQVMPVFQQVFEQMGLEMAGISLLVFQLSNLMQKISVIFLILFLILVAGTLLMIRSERGKSTITQTVQKFPPGKKISEFLACSRFCEAMELSIHSGMDLEESFDLAAELTDHTGFQKKVSDAKNLIEQDIDLPDALSQSGIITGLNARMISIGYRTGTSEEAFKRISVLCQDEADQTLHNTVGMLEPTLTAILSILTGMILISVMLPLLGVMTNIG